MPLASVYTSLFTQVRTSTKPNFKAQIDRNGTVVIAEPIWGRLGKILQLKVLQRKPEATDSRRIMPVTAYWWLAQLKVKNATSLPHREAQRHDGQPIRHLDSASFSSRVSHFSLLRVVISHLLSLSLSFCLSYLSFLLSSLSFLSFVQMMTADATSVLAREESLAEGIS